MGQMRLPHKWSDSAPPENLVSARPKVKMVKVDYFQDIVLPLHHSGRLRIIELVEPGLLRVVCASGWRPIRRHLVSAAQCQVRTHAVQQTASLFWLMSTSTLAGNWASVVPLNNARASSAFAHRPEIGEMVARVSRSYVQQPS
jgi:hypothetical protein